MNLIDVIILSIVEGITEFLPISSTGHLILTSRILNIPSTEFVKTFEIVIQLGAILAVFVLYWRRILNNFSLVGKVLTAFIPTVILGLIFYDIIKTILLESTLVVVIALFIGGIALIALELYFKDHKEKKKNLDSLTYKNAFIIGLFQSISMIPGVSRAAATIFGGLFMNLNRTAAVEFSFLLAVPTMAAASGLDLVKSSGSFTNQEIMQLVIGTVLSFIVALIVIKWLLKFIQTHTFIPFGIYRIILAIIFAIFFLL